MKSFLLSSVLLGITRGSGCTNPFCPPQEGVRCPTCKKVGPPATKPHSEGFCAARLRLERSLQAATQKCEKLLQEGKKLGLSKYPADAAKALQVNDDFSKLCSRLEDQLKELEELEKVQSILKTLRQISSTSAKPEA